MNRQPLVSIALCTYNGERYLRQQMDSLLAQDYAPWELVVVDDASSDSTPEILASYAALDPRVRVYRNAENIGLQANFRRAFSQCGGALIAPCDQDDLWLPDKLSRLTRALDVAGSTTMMAYCDSELVDEDGTPLGRRISDKLVLADIEDPAGFAFCNCVSGHAMLFRRELLDRALPFPDEVFYDWWLAFVAASVSRIVYVDAPLVRYRQHSGAQTDFSGLRSARGQSRPRGFKAADLRIIELRLAALAGFREGRRAEFFRTLYRLWRGRNHQLLCPGLTSLLLRDRQALYAFVRDERNRRIRRALKYFWGLPVKRLVQPRQYADVR